MKAYFTTSSRGVEENKSACRTIIKSIELLGHELTLDWIKLATDEKEPLKGRPANPKKIFKENLSALLKADVAIFEISSVSWGLGYQISYALAKDIPSLCLYKEGSDLKDLSNFLPGVDSDLLKIAKYNLDNICDTLEDYLSHRKKEALIKFNFVATQEIKDYIEWFATKTGVSQSKFLRDYLTKELIRRDSAYKKE